MHMSRFWFKLDCTISKFEAKTDYSDFSFVKLYYIKHLHETKTADMLHENANSFSDRGWRLWNSSDTLFSLVIAVNKAELRL